jgi:hypothetical protein
VAVELDAADVEPIASRSTLSAPTLPQRHF